MNGLLRVIEGRAARRKPRDQVRGILLPSVPHVIDGRSCPHLDSVTDRAQLSPCPVQVSPANVDLTVGHSFGKWQVAWVGFYSSDLNTPVLGYQKQSQFAMGGLLGYDFGPVVLQGYLTWERCSRVGAYRGAPRKWHLLPARQLVRPIPVGEARRKHFMKYD